MCRYHYTFIITDSNEYKLIKCQFAYEITLCQIKLKRSSYNLKIFNYSFLLPNACNSNDVFALAPTQMVVVGQTELIIRTGEQHSFSFNYQ